MMIKGSMKGMKFLTWCGISKCHFFTFAIYIVITCFLSLHKPFMNGCTMICMYPSYIHVLATLHDSINKGMFCICIMRGIRKLIISFILPSFWRCQVSLFQVVVVPTSRLEFWIHFISNSFGHFGIFVRVSCIWLGFYTLKSWIILCSQFSQIINFVLLFEFFLMNRCSLYICPFYYKWCP
jgi:hypothetical protein